MSKLLTSSNADYHADREYLSSSLFKMLYENPKEYYHKIILGHNEQKEAAHFDEGSYIHTMILEPHKLNDYAIFPGLRKQGAAWEEFKELNKGKTILSMPQKTRCEVLYKSYDEHIIATRMMAHGLSEHTMLSQFRDIKVKARADFINVTEGYIVDVKTTGSPSGAEIFKHTVEQYKYDLSAALYCHIAEQTYNKPFAFYWLVLSKEDWQCRFYKVSKGTMITGAHKLSIAAANYKKCLETGEWIDHCQGKDDTDLSEIQEI